MKEKALERIFNEAKNENKWGDPDSVSGKGSNLTQTVIIRNELPDLIKRYHITYMLDAPCGDFFWMKEIIQDLIHQLQHYTGIDIVEDVVRANNEKYANEKVSFLNLDLAEAQLKKYDLIFTRDCFIHLSYLNIYRILRNYKRSKSRYLLVSTYTDQHRNNRDLRKRLDFRPLNLQKFPFTFRRPLVIINEGCTEDGGIYADKSLALWEIKHINLWVFYVQIYIGKVLHRLNLFGK